MNLPAPPGPDYTDVHELVRCTGYTRQAVQAMAKREAWPHEATPAPAGRVRHWYPIAALPERLRFLVGYFRRNPFNLRREGHAVYAYMLSRREQIAKTDATIARLTDSRNQIAAELAAAGLSQ